MTGLELSQVLLPVLLNRTVPTRADVRSKLGEATRNTEITDEFGPIAAEFNRSLSKRIESRAKDLDHIELHSLALHWDILAEQIDLSEVVFETEEAAVTWLVQELDGLEDVDLDQEARDELEKLLGEEFRNAVDEFRERAVQDDELRQRLQAEFQIDVLEELAAIREAFDRLAYRRPYTLYSFPEKREQVIASLLPENAVEFVDREEVPDNPDPGRYIVIGPSGSGKTRVIAAWINRLRTDSIDHVLIPDERMIDPADAKGIAREDFDGNVLLVWEDIHRIDEGRDNLIIESVIRELTHTLEANGNNLYTLLEVQSGQLHNVPGNLPAAFNDEKSIWNAFDPLRVEQINLEFLLNLAVRMADKYDVTVEDEVLEALIEQTASRSAPIYLDTVLGTAGDELTLGDVEGLPDDIEHLWHIQYDDLQANSIDEWRVLASMKLLFDLNLPYYAKLIRTMYLDLFNGDRGQFRSAVEQLHRTRQWMDISGDDFVARQTRYHVHDAQLAAIRVQARDDAAKISEILLAGREKTLPTLVQPVAHLNAGVAFSRWGHTSLAVDQWDAALELNPTFPEVHYNYGWLLVRDKHDPKSAEIHFRKAIDYNPQFVEAYYSYGLILQEDLGRPEVAVDYYRRVLEVDPEFVEAHYNLGLVLHRDLDKPGEAEEHYETALKLDPEHASAHNNYGVLLKNDLDKPAEAQHHFEEALAIDPNYTLAHLNYADLLSDELGNTDAAEDHFEAALQLEPDNADIHHDYGTFLKENLGDEDEGEKHLGKARSLNPEKYKGANIQISKYPQDVSFETKKQTMTSRPTKVKLGADIPKNTSLSAIVKQDVSGDGEPDHKQTIHLMDGEHIYSLSGFDPRGGEVWLEIAIRSNDGQDTPALTSYGLYGEGDSSDRSD